MDSIRELSRSFLKNSCGKYKKKKKTRCETGFLKMVVEAKTFVYYMFDKTPDCMIFTCLGDDYF